MENRNKLKNNKIDCINITKQFGRDNEILPVLDTINLSVEENEFIVILGPGQSGKSTLLKIIAGLHKPSTGQVLLDGKEITGPGPDRGLVFQRYTLFPWKTVMGNVEMGPKLTGMGWWWWP